MKFVTTIYVIQVFYINDKFAGKKTQTNKTKKHEFKMNKWRSWVQISTVLTSLGISLLSFFVEGGGEAS